MAATVNDPSCTIYRIFGRVSSFFLDGMGTAYWRVYFNIILMVLLSPQTRQDKHKKPDGKHGSHDSSSEEELPAGREGLRCYKCDPTDYNNYCRDFKPNLATPYDCYVAASEGSKHTKNPTPLDIALDPDKPFSCYKIKGDVAYGHGKVYGAKRYGCGHLTKVRGTSVTTLDHECVDSKIGKDKSKDFFEGTICNCDNADGCNSSTKLCTHRIVVVVLFLISALFGWPY